jgi:hypothetical protein
MVPFLLASPFAFPRRYALALLICFLLCCMGQHSRAEPFLNSNPLGFGAIATKTGARQVPAVVLEGSNHFRQRVGFYGTRQYGFAESRAELGSSPALALSASTGITVLGLEKREHASLHLGVEPFNGRVSWRSSDTGRSFYQWLPTASLGAQLAGGPCRALALARAGGGVGNFGTMGLRPRLRQASGSAVHLNCSQADLGFEILNLGKGGEGAVFRTFDLTWNIPQSSWKLGTRAEWISAQAAPQAERRWLVVMRTNPME